MQAQQYSAKYSGDNKAKDAPQGIEWKFGFTSSAENWNGRMAMLGFAGILGIVPHCPFKSVVVSNVYVCLVECCSDKRILHGMVQTVLELVTGQGVTTGFGLLN